MTRRCGGVRPCCFPKLAGSVTLCLGMAERIFPQATPLFTKQLVTKCKIAHRHHQHQQKYQPKMHKESDIKNHDRTGIQCQYTRFTLSLPSRDQEHCSDNAKNVLTQKGIYHQIVSLSLGLARVSRLMRSIVAQTHLYLL